MNYRIDLVLLADPIINFKWSHGQIYYLPTEKENYCSFIIDKLKKSESDYILFWDADCMLPSIDLLIKLCDKRYDLIHGSYWENEKIEPRFLDYVKPIWLYNLQAQIDIEFSSFRCISKNVLVKTSVFKDNFSLVDNYKSLDSNFLDFGYKLLKNGGITRYHPFLNQQKKIIGECLSPEDNIYFVKKYHGKKWSIYARIRAFLNNEISFKSLIKKYKEEKSLPFKKTKIESKKNDIDKVSISVLSPTLDRYWYINNTINQLQEQTLKPLEILITDQTDESKRQNLEIENIIVPVKYFVQKDKGQVLAWNKLINEAKGDYLLFLGDDADKIYPKFCFDLMKSLVATNSDMMAARVVEKGITYNNVPKGIYMSDTFPITLIKKNIVLSSGKYNMFFNKGIRADADLAIRCHLNGALLLINNDIEIFHHRAPSGGLRIHKQRKVTFYMSQNNIRDYIVPTETEFYIAHKYFTKKQIKEELIRRKLSLFTVKGNLFRKVLKFIYILFMFLSINKKIRINKREALNQLKIEK